MPHIYPTFRTTEFLQNMTWLIKVTSRLKRFGRCSSWYWNSMALTEFKSFFHHCQDTTNFQSSCKMSGYNARKTTNTNVARWDLAILYDFQHVLHGKASREM